MERKYKVSLSIIFLLLITWFFIKQTKDKKEIEVIKQEIDQDTIYSSNIIENVRYESKDIRGNEYVIEALKGEIDHKIPNVIFLTNVKATIKPINSSKIIIKSNYGKYFIDNNDTIFSKNVIITFLDNKFEGEYLDFPILRNSMTLSRNVVYSSLNNVMKADVIEINLETKKAKVFMFEDKKKLILKIFSLMAIIKKFRIKSFKNIKSLIELENVSLSYGNRLILDNINFKINEGQIFGMLGPNGVGKSSIFNLITGLINPNNGKIKIAEQDVTNIQYI